MSSFKDTTEESRIAWETNADFWDDKMGDQSNYFHCNIVRPRTESLLETQQGDFVLDIACGNGNFSQRLVENGTKVVAFDYSEKLIYHAKRRRADFLSEVEFKVCDATNYDQLMLLKREIPFNKAVANMAIMDISDIEPLMQAVYEMLSEDGIFVFSTHHPCFVKPDHTYATACLHKGIAIKGQPALQNYYHRSLQDLFGICQKAGFVMDGFYEESDGSEENPVIIIVRLRK
ncbi:class I SAM-dependent methyltransferase [Psychrobacillus sp.]|uniref:class I SAM-dependent methyltransferase n=1 Tax=Psychrobacillus sp. TaxID=1871623 RepID=UPI0028BE8E15|nr:class I SAM-dependent methyltransferase [Psychrobacillus sp.]